MSKLYVLGDRGSGVLFIKTDPLRLTHLSKATIDAYAHQKGLSYDTAFAAIAAGAKAIVNKTQTQPDTADLDSSYEAIGNLIGKGTVLSDVDFCFAAEIDDTDWSTHRGAVPPLSAVLADLNPANGPDAQLREGTLI
jgi:inactivated superfamily I helicase